MPSWCLAQHLTHRRPVFLGVVWEVCVLLVFTLYQLPGGRKDGKCCSCSMGRCWEFISTFWFHVLPVSVQSLSCVQLCNPVNCSTLGFPVLRYLLEFAQTLMSVESVMPFNHLILCCPCFSCPLSFPASGSFPMSRLFTSDGHSIGDWTWASASVLPRTGENIHP